MSIKGFKRGTTCSYVPMCDHCKKMVGIYNTKYMEHGDEFAKRHWDYLCGVCIQKSENELLDELKTA